MQNKLSIIIPTHNRRKSLGKCLDALLRQDALENIYEIIIVDDGSTDGTVDFVKEKMRTFSGLRYLYQENRGPAVARNQGIKIAQGDIILFIGDDIIATPSLVRQHLEWHARYLKENEAVLGYITWSPELEITDFMYWLENGGPVLSYPLIKDKIEVNFRFFYTGNVSLKTAFLKENLFNEDFHCFYEDTELGYRLTTQKGLKIFFNKDAIAYHYHSMTPRDLEGRMAKLGKSAKIFLTKYPELENTFRLYPLWLLRLCGLIATSLYPLAKLIGWKKIIYHHLYNNRLLRIFYLAYSGKISSME